MNLTTEIQADVNSLVHQYLEKIDKSLAQTFMKKTKAKPRAKNQQTLLDIIAKFNQANKAKAESSSDSSEEDAPKKPTIQTNGKVPATKKKS